ncbi:CRISPR-associated helicase Cas3' [Pectinatus frisingensis]|uniref:CRISPR-associated helicase Cas3' n=1 Tax=Pectinatus frisingensis TaxID=865 RepID=UPI003D809BF0
MEKYIAKSKTGESIWEHSKYADDLLTEFMSIYGDYFIQNEKELIRLAVKYHDIGKSNPHFQQKMHLLCKKKYVGKTPEGEAIPHGFLSPAYLDLYKLVEMFTEEDLKILVTAIFNHHTREDYYKDIDIERYIKRNMPIEYLDEAGNKFYLHEDCEYLANMYDELRNNHKGVLDEEIYLKYIVIKGMLNRIDYAASAGEKTIEIEPPSKGFLIDKVNSKWELRPVQKYMQQHKKENIVIIASTGCGKTEAALLWLDGYKTFYTLPLKVSINAIYERIRHDYSYDESKITLLHSGMLSYYFTQNDNNTTFKIAEEPLERQKKARLLSFPLTVCTVDQLFYFVFKAMGTELIPATLKYSHLVIDEIQMYSPDILAYILYGLKIITKLGGKFAIITATFPPILQELMQENNIEFIPPQEKYYVDKCDRRHKIKCIDGEFEYDQIFSKGQKYKVLVLCNTVVKAQKVYRELLKYNNSSEHKVTIKLLHSRFIRKHRALLENEIKEDAKSNNPIIWISTQIVEASLDISYDILFTEMCPADSLLQRMGRCYRSKNHNEGNLDGQPNVYIYNNGNGLKTVYKFDDIYNRSWDLLQQYNNKIFTEKEKFDYIDTVYAVDKLKGSKYYLKIKENIKNLENLLPNEFSLDEAHKLFRNIQSITILPDKLILIYPRIRELIDILSQNKKMLLAERIKYEEELMEYTVDIPAKTLVNKSKYVDKNVIDKVKQLNIHRSCCKYTFLEKAMTGIGIEIEKAEDENNMI